MANPHEDLKEIDQLLANITLEAETNRAQRASIQYEIEQLRKKLSELQGEATNLQARKRDLHNKRQLAERQIVLYEEEKAAKEELERLKAETLPKIKDYPWFTDAKSWQVDGAIKLAAAKRAILADNRGLGKTFSSIIWRRVIGSHKTLILTRKQYCDTFIQELQKWEPKLTIVPMVSTPSVQRKAIAPHLKQSTNLVVVANFEMWRRSTDDAISDLLSIDFDGIILDEAHQIKTFKSVTNQGYLQLAHNIPYILEMTGTPLRNRPQELFSLLHALYPKAFPSINQYMRDYCHEVSPNQWVWRHGSVEELFNKIGKFYVSRDRKDVGIDVPPPAWHEYKLEWNGEYEAQHEAYRQITERSLVQLKKVDPDTGTPVVASIPGLLALMTRQRQMALWPAGIEFNTVNPRTMAEERLKFDVHQGIKIDWAEDLLKELVEEEQRVVLFSMFIPPIHELQKRLSSIGISSAVITGETNRDYNKEVINDFDLKTAPDKPKYSILMATYQTVSEAVNLNAARHAILLDRNWNPAGDDQAVGRLDRMNNIDQCTVHVPSIEGTIDMYMKQLIENKANMLQGFTNAAELRQGLIENLEGSL